MPEKTTIIPTICQYYFKPKEECMRMTAILASHGVFAYHVRMDGKRRTCMGDIKQCYFKAGSRPHTRPYTQPQEASATQTQTTAIDVLIIALTLIDKEYSNGTVFEKLKSETAKCEFVTHILELGEFKFNLKLPEIFTENQEDL